MKTVFIFGLGYVGVPLAQTLADQGWQIRGTTRTPSKLADKADQGWQILPFQAGQPLADPAAAFADIHQLVWEKFICNVMCSAPSVAFDCTIGELFNDEDRRIISLGCMLEAYEIGLAKNIAFSFDDAVAYGVKFAADMPHASPSMRLDHLAGKRSEIDAINGMVPVLGREMGIKTPYNDTLVALVRAREASFA